MKAEEKDQLKCGNAMKKHHLDRMWSLGCCATKHLTTSLHQSGLKAVIRSISGQIDLVESIPLQINPQQMSSNLKTHLGHKYMAIDFNLGSPSVIITPAAYIAMAVDPTRRFICPLFFKILLGV